MKISKVATATARRLFGICFVNGELNDDKLRQLVASLIQQQPRDYQAILYAIRRLTRIECSKRNVVIESAETLSPSESQKILSGLAKDYGSNLNIQFVINPSLLGGIRIKVGDDVLDGSVKGRIDRLAKAF